MVCLHCGVRLLYVRKYIALCTVLHAYFFVLYALIHMQHMQQVCSDPAVIFTWAQGKSKCVGYVNFTNKEDVREALEKMKGHSIDGQRVKCICKEVTEQQEKEILCGQAQYDVDKTDDIFGQSYQTVNGIRIKAGLQYLKADEGLARIIMTGTLDSMHRALVELRKIDPSIWDLELSEQPKLAGAPQGQAKQKKYISMRVTNLSPNTDEDALITAFARKGVKGVVSTAIEWEADSHRKLPGDKATNIVLDMINKVTADGKHAKAEFKALYMFPEKETKEGEPTRKGAFKVRAAFSNWDFAQAVIDEYDGRAAARYKLSNNGRIRVRREIGCRFTIDRGIACALRASIESLLEDIRGHGFVYADVVEKTKAITICLKGYLESHVLWAKQLLNRLLTPEPFSFREEGEGRSALLSRESRKYIEGINQSMPGVHLRWDKVTDNILIYGQDCGKLLAREQLERYAQQHYTGQKTDTFELRSGEIKAFVGRKLQKDEEILEESGCTRVHLDIRRQKIVCQGSQEALAKARSLIEKTLAEAEASGRTETTSARTVGTCPICRCEIEDTPGAYVRLQGCGHAYCQVCIVHILASHASPGGPMLPIRCFHRNSETGESCDRLLWTKDIVTLCKPETLGKLHARAYDLYVKKHSKKLGLVKCPSQVCEQVVRRDHEGPWTCDCCAKTFCIKCSLTLNSTTEAHPEMTCEEFRAKIGLGAVSPETRRTHEWIENRLRDGTYKKCPGCDVPQEREGCNRVTCYECGLYFCFKCAQFCSEYASEVYDHIDSCTGARELQATSND
jgi:hypothetical protein